MKPLRFLLTCALFAPALGCSVSRQDVELLERDLRIQEDEIYALQDCVQSYQQKLESCRSENRALRKELASKGGSSDDFTKPSAPTSSTPNFDPGSLPPAGQQGFPKELDPGQLQEAPAFIQPEYSPPDPNRSEGIPPGPQIESPGAEGIPSALPPVEPESGAAVDTGDGAALVAHHAPRAQQGSGGARALLDKLAAANEEPEIVDPVHDLEVTEITLNRMLTGGMNRDHRNGDEGILVVVEPRNPKNQIVPALGEISIVVLDPALEGEAARIARWDITPQELENSFRGRKLGRGLQLALPWPGDPPQHTDLHLFVRFVADDGRKLIADRELKIEPPGGGSDGGWVPVSQPTAATPRLAPPAVGPQLLPSEVADSAEARALPVPEPQRIHGTPTLAPPEPEAAPSVASNTAAAPTTPVVASNTPSPAEHTDSNVTQATKEEPSAPAKKKRPSWSPYRK